MSLTRQKMRKSPKQKKRRSMNWSRKCWPQESHLGQLRKGSAPMKKPRKKTKEPEEEEEEEPAK